MNMLGTMKLLTSKVGVAVYTNNPRTGEVEAGRSLRLADLPVQLNCPALGAEGDPVSRKKVEGWRDGSLI